MYFIDFHSHVYPDAIAPKAADSIREFSMYVWEEGRDAPVKENDHAMDDIRYFVSTVLNNNLSSSVAVAAKRSV